MFTLWKGIRLLCCLSNYTVLCVTQWVSVFITTYAVYYLTIREQRHFQRTRRFFKLALRTKSENCENLALISFLHTVSLSHRNCASQCFHIIIICMSFASGVWCTPFACGVWCCCGFLCLPWALVWKLLQPVSMVRCLVTRSVHGVYSLRWPNICLISMILYALYRIIYTGCVCDFVVTVTTALYCLFLIFFFFLTLVTSIV